jgi:hypothetical protein
MRVLGAFLSAEGDRDRTLNEGCDSDVSESDTFANEEGASG